MVSDYKFHLFCKRLKKEKWRLCKDLSPAVMPMIFHCCFVDVMSGGVKQPMGASRPDV